MLIRGVALNIVSPFASGGDDVSTLLIWFLQGRYVKMLQRLYTESDHKCSSLSLQAALSVLET